MRKIDVIAVMVHNGQFAGWAELMPGILEDNQKNGKAVYVVKRNEPLNRYYKISMSDLKVGEMEDTFVIEMEKEKWVNDGFDDSRIQSVGPKELGDLWMELFAIAIAR